MHTVILFKNLTEVPLCYFLGALLHGVSMLKPQFQNLNFSSEDEGM